jgi:hypothetical protein
VEQAAVHAGQQAAVGMQRDAGQALVGGPALVLLVGGAPAVERAALDVHPVERDLGRAPQRAFAHGVAVRAEQQVHGGHDSAHSKGPVRTNGPPW